LLGVMLLAGAALYLKGSLTVIELLLDSFRSAKSPAGTLAVALRETATVTPAVITSTADASPALTVPPPEAGVWSRYNNSSQNVAVAAGLSPTKVASAKIVILGSGAPPSPTMSRFEGNRKE